MADQLPGVDLLESVQAQLGQVRSRVRARHEVDEIREGLRRGRDEGFLAVTERLEAVAVQQFRTQWWYSKEPSGFSRRCGRPVVTLVVTGTCSGTSPWCASADWRLT